MYDIAIEGELFLIEGGIVSHNCNYGIAQSGTTIPAQGKFVPGYWEGDTFIYEPYCGTGMTPKRPVFYNRQPINYIQTGDLFFNIRIKQVLNKLRSK